MFQRLLFSCCGSPYFSGLVVQAIFLFLVFGLPFTLLYLNALRFKPDLRRDLRFIEGSLFAGALTGYAFAFLASAYLISYFYVGFVGGFNFGYSVFLESFPFSEINTGLEILMTGLVAFLLVDLRDHTEQE
jgi:hypothetical protein